MNIVPSKKLIDKLLCMEVDDNDFHQSTLNIMYQEWQTNYIGYTYKEILDWFEDTYDSFAKFAVLIGKYNQQVCNGGHIQYFDNGYANGDGGCFYKHSSSIPLHNELIKLFEKTELKEDELSLKVLKILKKFEIEEEDDEILNYDYLRALDSEYYKLCNEFMELINDYIKHKIIGESKC